MSKTKQNEKVALVTGASAGIGKAIVRRLLADGWTVYGAARRTNKMEDIRSEGAKVLSLDVTDDSSMRTAVEGILAAEGHIDALVNNAGYGSYGAIESEWAGIAAENLLAHSAGSAYSTLVEPMARLLSDYNIAAGPEVVAEAVSRAVNSRRPRRRYATPMDAKTGVFLRWLLPDAVWDRLIAAAFRLAGGRFRATARESLA